MANTKNKNKNVREFTWEGKESSFGLAVNFAPVHIVFTDIDGFILFANPAAQKLTGYTEKEMLGEHPRLWGGLMSQAFYKHMWHEIKDKRKVFRGEFTNQRKNGEKYFADACITPVIVNGNLLGFVGVERDITEEKKLLETVKNNAERLKQITESMTEVFFLCDLENNEMLYISPSVNDILGCKTEEISKCPESIFKAVIAEDQPIIQYAWKKIKEGHEQRFEARIEQTNKHIRWVRVYCFPVYNEQRKIYRIAGVAEDITEEKEISQKNSELEILKNKFIQVMSNQVRTPLNITRWNLDSMISGNLGPLSSTQKNFLELTRDITLSINKKLENLLVVIDIEEGRMSLNKEKISLATLVRGAILRPKKECTVKDIRCIFDGPKNSRVILSIDAEKINRILNILIDNAIKYSNKGGVVVMTLMIKDKKAKISISDKGIGIPESEQSRVFTRFFRGSNASIMEPDASGLGLYLVKKIVEEHGGEIGFTSKEGKGSTFWFSLPIDGK